ncbi:MAG: hypothetical protein R3F37_11650 [Candidatus Competibacteraceae bacterium]
MPVKMVEALRDAATPPWLAGQASLGGHQIRRGVHPVVRQGAGRGPPRQRRRHLVRKRTAGGFRAQVRAAAGAAQRQAA